MYIQDQLLNYLFDLCGLVVELNTSQEPKLENHRMTNQSHQPIDPTVDGQTSHRSRPTGDRL